MTTPSQFGKLTPMHEDLEAFISVFDQWQNLHFTQSKEKKQLELELEKERSEKQRLHEYNELIKEDSTKLQRMIEDVHSKLEKICEIEDENRHLKEKLTQKQKENCRLNQSVTLLEDQHKKEVETLRRQYEEDKTETVKKLQEKVDLEIKNVQNEVSLKEKEIEFVHSRITEIENEKQVEINRLSVEYENKIAKLQRQKMQTSMAQTNFSNQEIFRKKLQHMKNEHEQEIMHLKKTISDLTKRCDALNARSSLPSAKKKKY